MFKGVYTAMVTPFKDGKVDVEKFAELVKRQKDAKVAGVLIGGCTGESFTLKLEERKILIETALQFKDKNFKIIAGTGSNSTEIAIKLTEEAEKLGVDAVLLITPFGNKPSQNGLIKYYKDIAERTSLDIILYNVPGRTGVNLLPETVARLQEVKNIKAIKQAFSDFDMMTKLRLLAPDIDLLSGEDTLTLPLLSIGGKGVICTVSNLVPEMMNELVNSYFDGNYERSRELHFKLFPVIKAMFIESNPAPLKYALSRIGLLNGELRPPLVNVKEESAKVIDSILKDLKLI